MAVFRICWQQGLIYRLNFILWRVRSVLQLLLIYFVWWTVFQSQDQVFGYTNSSILTYILVAALIRAIVLSSRTTSVANQINDGSVVNFLVKPLGFIKFYLAQDLADKLLNIFFVIIEISLLIILLKPEIIIQNNPIIILLFLLAAILGMILYFCISFIISLTAFWVENSWGPLFILTIILEGFSGGMFPLDILPKSIFSILMLTPFPYLIYFPSKIYLGNMHYFELLYGFMVLFFWVIASFFLMYYVLRSGLKHYTAEGH